MTTETTTTALPTDLPEITDEMVERARITYVKTYVNGGREDYGMRAVLTEFRADLIAGIPLWQPIEHDQIKAGMRIRATIPHEERTSIYIGVAYHEDREGGWRTEGGWQMTGWSDPTTYEVDPSTIPADPDADLIEKLIGLLDLTDSEDAREVVAAVRAHDGRGEK